MYATPLLWLAIEGRTAPVDLTRRILSLTVDEEVRKATKITVSLNDPDGLVRSGQIIAEGLELTVRWGYVGRVSAPRAGVVHSIKPSYDNDTVEIEAYGRELALSRGTVHRSFRGRSFRQAVEQLTRDAGLTVRWDAPEGIVFDAQTVHNEHVWRWLLRRTAELGLECDLNANGELLVREPAFGEAAAVVLHYGWRDAELLEFEPETNTQRNRGENEGVVAVMFDPASGETLRHAAGDPTVTRAVLTQRRLQADAARQARQREQTAQDAGVRTYVQQHPELASQTPEQQRAAYQQSLQTRATNGPRPTEDHPEALQRFDADTGTMLDPGNLPAAPPAETTTPGSTTPPASQEQHRPTVVAADRAAAQQHLRQVAEGRFRQAERQRVRARATAIGNPFLRKGIVVQVVGVAARDAGQWYVHAAHHKFEGEYTTELELRREGVNGNRGRRTQGPTRPNPTPATTAPSAAPPERQVQVNLNGRET